MVPHVVERQGVDVGPVLRVRNIGESENVTLGVIVEARDAALRMVALAGVAATHVIPLTLGRASLDELVPYVDEACEHLRVGALGAIGGDVHECVIRVEPDAVHRDAVAECVAVTQTFVRATLQDLQRRSDADLTLHDGRHRHERRALRHERAGRRQRRRHRCVRGRVARGKRREIEVVGERPGGPQHGVARGEPGVRPRRDVVGSDDLQAVLRPSEEAGRTRAEPLRQVTTDLRAGAALPLDLQDLELLREPVDRQVAEVLGDAAVERNDVLWIAGNEEPRAHAVDGAVVEVREVTERLEGQVLDDVRDARRRAWTRRRARRRTPGPPATVPGSRLRARRPSSPRRPRSTPTASPDNTGIRRRTLDRFATRPIS